MNKFYRIVEFYATKNNVSVAEVIENINKRGYSEEEVEDLIYFQEDPEFNPFLLMLSKYFKRTENFKENLDFFDQHGLKNELACLYFGLINLGEKQNYQIGEMLGRLDKQVKEYKRTKKKEFTSIKKMLINTIKFNLINNLEYFDQHTGIDQRITGLCYTEVLTKIIKATDEEDELLTDQEIRIFYPGVEFSDYNYDYLKNLDIQKRHEIDEIVNLIVNHFDNKQEKIYGLLEPIVEMEEAKLDEMLYTTPNPTEKKEEPLALPKAEVDFSKLEQELKQHIIGQDAQIEQFVKRLKIKDYEPLKDKGAKAVFLLAGPTGVGKTELAKLLSKYTSQPLVRMDMSEYKEAHSVSKIYGSPPGYVGYDERGNKVFDQISKYKHAVVLIDEIEKAHPRVLDTFLHIFDEGKAKDNRQKEINFSETTFVLTTNIGSFEASKNTIGFGEKNEKPSQYQAAIEDTLKPEFINRIDEIIYFKHLEKEDIYNIIDLSLEQISQKLEKKEFCYKFSMTEEAYEYLINKIDYQTYGARDVFRVLDNEMIEKLIDLGEKNKKLNLEVTYEDEFQLKPIKPKVKKKKKD